MVSDPIFDGLHSILSLRASMLIITACPMILQLHWTAAAWEAVTASAHSILTGLIIPYSTPPMVQQSAVV